MNSRLVRIGALATSIVAGGMLIAPASLAADNTCIITDNGSRSRNYCRIKVVKKSTTVQINSAKVKNSVTVVSNTGGNKANNNTGGSVTVDSGNSTVTVEINNTLNSNAAPPAGP
mgnify:CR=1 FL=1